MGKENYAKKRKRQGKPKIKFIYGNYPCYYGYRTPKHEEDPRLAAFKKEWFEGKDCLDIGCNGGLVTINIATKFLCRSIQGIDIDEGLVRSAEQNLQKLAQKINAQNERDNLISIVTFKQENFINNMNGCSEKYDTIICLSVAKWIHLNWGDEGLIKAFVKIWRLLRPGGKFVFEPQPWSSYKKNRLVSETAAENFNRILIYPPMFKEILLDKVGFRYAETITDSLSGTVTGFDRPIMVFGK